MKTMTLSVFAALFFAIVADGNADEQNGISVTSSRKTTDRTATKGESDTTKLKQGLKVDVKNLRLRPLPEGELKWTVLVKRRWEGYFKYTGTEKLKPLRSQQSAELFVGDFGVSSTRSTEGISKERVEYQIVFTHEGKETYRFATESNFLALAKDATSADRKGDDGGDANAEGKTAEVDPKKMPADPKMVPDSAKKTMPAGGTPATAGNTPPATPGKPAPAEEPKVKLPPVDFFNLGGK